MFNMLQESICYLDKKKIWHIRISVKRRTFMASNKDFYKAIGEIRSKFIKWYNKKEYNIREIGRAFDKQIDSLAMSGVHEDTKT